LLVSQTQLLENAHAELIALETRISSLKATRNVV
jgi:hypothetical protein